MHAAMLLWWIGTSVCSSRHFISCIQPIWPRENNNDCCFLVIAEAKSSAVWGERKSSLIAKDNSWVGRLYSRCWIPWTQSEISLDSLEMLYSSTNKDKTRIFMFMYLLQRSFWKRNSTDRLQNLRIPYFQANSQMIHIVVVRTILI